MTKVDKEVGELLKQDIEELAKSDNVCGTAADIKQYIPFGNELPNNMINIAADYYFEFTDDKYADVVEIVSSPVINSDDSDDSETVDLFRHIMNGIEFFHFDYEEGESIFIHQLDLPRLINHLRSLLPEVNEI